MQSMTYDQAICMCGCLRKKSTGNGVLHRRDWKRRWFAVEESGAALLYFTSKSSTVAKGRIPLQGYEVRRINGKEDGAASPSAARGRGEGGATPAEKRALRFELVHFDSERRRLQLQADSAAELQQWIATLVLLTEGVSRAGVGLRPDGGAEGGRPVCV